MRKERNSDRGFTLAEMLVAFAVLAIALSGIAGLLNLATNYYSNSRREVEVQNQLQATFAQVSNMIIDANIDVRFDAASHRATIINSDNYYAVELNDGNLYIVPGEYSLNSLSESAKINEAISATVPKQSQNILADHVETFLVDTSSMTKGYVVLAVRITYDSRSAYLSQNVFLRNYGSEVEDYASKFRLAQTSNGTTSVKLDITNSTASTIPLGTAMIFTIAGELSGTSIGYNNVDGITITSPLSYDSTTKMTTVMMTLSKDWADGSQISFSIEGLSAAPGTLTLHTVQ